MIISSWLFKSQDMFVWQKDKGRGENFLDGGAAFYDTYRTKDGKFMAVGALEPQFFAELSRILSENGLSLDLEQFSGSTRDKLSSAFSTRTQQEWVDIFDRTDACVTPVVCGQRMNTISSGQNHSFLIYVKIRWRRTKLTNTLTIWRESPSFKTPALNIPR